MHISIDRIDEGVKALIKKVDVVCACVEYLAFRELNNSAALGTEQYYWVERRIGQAKARMLSFIDQDRVEAGALAPDAKVPYR